MNMANFCKETELKLNAILTEYKNKFDEKKLSTWSYGGFKTKLESLINYLNGYLEEDINRVLSYGTIIANFSKLQDGVNNNYDNLIYNVRNMNKTKDIEEYLK